MKVVVGEFISQKVREKFYFHPNPGNAGDSLINVGCYDCFESYGLDYDEFSDGLTCDLNKYKDKIVILGGGGGFIPAWSFTKDFVSRFHKVCKLLILLPHTVSGNEDILSELGDNVIIFAREEKTLSHLQIHLTGGAQVQFADDMAFSVDIKKINKIVKPKLSLRHEAKNIVNLFRGNFFRIINNGKVNAFRNDAEKTDVKIPKYNFDVSIAFTFGTSTEKHNRYSAYKLLNYLNSCSAVSTNRLHGAIGSALLGKNVDFYPNNYFKCKAVYEASLRNKYKNVKWIDD